MQARARREMIGILGLLTALAPLAIDMYLPAVVGMAEVFHSDVAHVQWTLSSFLLGFAFGQMLYGPAADRWGRKRPLYVGLTVFVISSVGCALAPSLEMLTALRFFQAVGACAGGVIGRAMVRDCFELREAPRVFASLMLVMGIAPMLAPLMGTALLKVAEWHGIFWALTGAGLLAFVLSGLRLPETHRMEARKALGFGDVFLGYGQLLRDRFFMAHALAGGVGMAGMFTYISASPAVFMRNHGIPQEHFSWFFGLNALGLVLAAQINGRLLYGRAPRTILVRAQVAQSLAGVVMLVNAMTGFGGLLGIAAPLFVFIACQGFIMPSSSALAMAPQGARAGMASALLGTLQFSCGAMASYLVGLWQKSNTTDVPMPVVMLGCAVSGVVIYRALCPRHEQDT